MLNQLLSICFCVLTVSTTLFSQVIPFSFSEGVVVDNENSTIYLLNEDRGLESIDAHNGRTLWRTPLNLKPISLFKDQLLCVNLGDQDKDNIHLAELSATKKNRTTRDIILAMPPRLVSKLSDSPGRFRITSNIGKDETNIYWRFQHIDKDGTMKAQSNLPRYAGAIGMSHSTENQRPLNNKEIENRLKMHSIKVPASKRIFGVEGRQYYSRDKKHILVSIRVNSSAPGKKFRWRIYNASNKKYVGLHQAIASYAPFFVLNETLIYTSPPNSIVVNGAIQKNPLELKAINLSNDNLIWRHEIYNFRLTGPSPS